MAEVTLILCDVCRDPDVGIKHYEVRVGGQRYVLDLCDRDAEPIQLLLDVVGSKQKEARVQVRTSRRSPLRVRTMEEIEALKRAR